MNVGSLLVLALLAAAGGSSATLRDSNVTFKQALHSCGGALGSVSFALGHARIATLPGVDMDESPPGPISMISVVLQSASGGQSAKVTIDQTHRTVAAKNVRLKMSGSVACILPD